MSDSIPLVQELPGEQDVGGASGARRFYFLAYGKGNSEEYPYNIPNEKIASDLARIVGLPVPEILLHQHRESWLFLSRAVGSTALGESKPPGTSADVAGAIANSPGIIEEMVCFDLFVCNNDRNPGNFLCDSEKRLWLIDFGNSLFYRPSGQGRVRPGIPRLQSVEADLGALFDKPYGFLEHCRSWEGVRRGCERVAAIPDYFIQNTVSRLPSGLLTDEERDFLIAFLVRRKSQMEIIVRKNSARFPHLNIPSLT